MRACSALNADRSSALPQPIIAAVDEIATAAGCQLVASCDLAVAGPARAILHAGGRHRPVLRDAGRGALPQRCAKACDGDAAYRRSNRRRRRPAHRPRQPHVSRWRKDRRVGAGASHREKSPQAIRFGKRAFYAQSEKPLSDAYELASAVMVENMLAEDAKEGVAAFLEKRAPTWVEKLNWPYTLLKVAPTNARLMAIDPANEFAKPQARQELGAATCHARSSRLRRDADLSCASLS